MFQSKFKEKLTEFSKSNFYFLHKNNVCLRTVVCHVIGQGSNFLSSLTSKVREKLKISNRKRQQCNKKNSIYDLCLNYLNKLFEDIISYSVVY